MYFDYNASAPLLDIARDAVIEAMGYTGNASSVHGCGRATRRLLEDARAAVASSVSAAPQEVVFTSGATEANALACAGRSPSRIAATAIEHDSVLAAAAPGRRVEGGVEPGQDVAVRAVAADGAETTFTARCRIDTPVEAEYYRHGGILQYVLRGLLAE